MKTKEQSTPGYQLEINGQVTEIQLPESIELSSTTARMFEAIQMAYKALVIAADAVEETWAGDGFDKYYNILTDGHQAFQQALWNIATEIMFDNGTGELKNGRLFGKL